jgi:hypothetical protein
MRLIYHVLAGTPCLDSPCWYDTLMLSAVENTVRDVFTAEGRKLSADVSNNNHACLVTGDDSPPAPIRCIDLGLVWP